MLHKLNECGTSASAIYRQGLGEFFLDDLRRNEAAYIAPAKEVEARLVAILQDNRQAVSLHHRPYSVVSYAWGQKYQQLNQWVIETLAFAMAPYAKSRSAAQDWLQRQGYVPAELRIGTLTRLGGRVSAANVAFDDHPPAKRFTDRIQTVTADSVFEWMQHAGLGNDVSTFQLEPETISKACCRYRPGISRSRARSYPVTSARAALACQLTRAYGRASGRTAVISRVEVRSGLP